MRNGALIVAAVVSEVENNYSTTVEELVVLKVIRDVSLNKKKGLQKYLCSQRAPALEREKLVPSLKGAFIRETP